MTNEGRLVASSEIAGTTDPVPATRWQTGSAWNCHWRALSEYDAPGDPVSLMLRARHAVFPWGSRDLLGAFDAGGGELSPLCTTKLAGWLP